MTQEEKDLLLKDLYARIPYGVKILHQGWNYEWDQELSTVEKVTGIDERFIYTKVIDTHNGEEYRGDKWPIDTFDDKLYLFPLSSMTEEEYKEYTDIDNRSYSCPKDYAHIPASDRIDWLNKHHFDYHGLIEKGLALDATGLNIY